MTSTEHHSDDTSLLSHLRLNTLVNPTISAALLSSKNVGDSPSDPVTLFIVNYLMPVQMF